MVGLLSPGPNVKGLPVQTLSLTANEGIGGLVWRYNVLRYNGRYISETHASANRNIHITPHHDTEVSDSKVKSLQSGRQALGAACPVAFPTVTSG